MLLALSVEKAKPTSSLKTKWSGTCGILPHKAAPCYEQLTFYLRDVVEANNAGGNHPSSHTKNQVPHAGSRSPSLHNQELKHKSLSFNLMIWQRSIGKTRLESLSWKLTGNRPYQGPLLKCLIPETACFATSSTNDIKLSTSVISLLRWSSRY